MLASHAQVPTKLSDPLLWKTPVPKKAIDRRQKKRSKMPTRKQLKVRLIEKSLSHNTKPWATATTATATQAWMMKPTAASTKWPNAKLTPIPLTVYNVPTAKIQEVPRSSIWKPQEEEVPFIPIPIILWGNNSQYLYNPRLQPLPQLPYYQQETIPHGPTLFQPQQIYLLPGHGQFPQMGMKSKCQPSLRWRRDPIQKVSHQSRQKSPAQWSWVIHPKTK